MAKTDAWVLLRGLGREVGHWGSFVERFQAAFPDDEVLALDLPGVGEFRSAPSPMGLHEIFRFVRAQAVARASTQGQFKLVTISLGGMVALEWLRAQSADLAGAVLINTSTRQSPIFNRLRWQIWPEFLRIVAAQTVKEREKRLVDLLINSAEAREKALPLWIKLGHERGVPYLTIVNQLIAASRFRGLSEPVSVPVLLLSGLGDRFVDPSCTTALAERWSWPVERHAWGGHDLTWDDPDWVIQKIKSWNESL